jgi:hypothetical protein
MIEEMMEMKNLFIGVLALVFLTMVLPTAASAAKPVAMAKSTETAKSAEIWPIKIEPASVLPRGQLQLDAGLAFESGRELLGFEYDNFRIAPFGLRIGLGDDAEVGGFIAFSDNSEEDDGGPNDSGLEGLTLFGKLALNSNISLQAGLTFGGDDDIAPYANDGLDLFVNLPMQKRIGPGMLYGQFGYRAQGGDFDNSSYFNYGVGYGLPLDRMLALNVELVGEQAQKLTNNTLDLVLGLNIMADEKIRIAPYLSFGLYEDSPDVALGAFIHVMF